MKLLHTTLGTLALVALSNAIAPMNAIAQQATPSDTVTRVVSDDFVALASEAIADGDYHNAVYHANKALDIDTELAAAYLVRGQALIHLEERDAAIADLEKAANLYLSQNNLVGHQIALESLSGV
ncbi:MAG: hypothetical protein SWY16_00680 [Cyanobacteriota bacterium]|nr:hypothetical protein [Cyanobacteriota bacterium]